MRPLAAMGVLYGRIAGMVVVLPVNGMAAPVSPSNAWRRLSRYAPSCHTMASDWPSDVVTIGEPSPLNAHHEGARVGGAPGTTLTAVRSPVPAPHAPLTATYAAVAVVY